MNGVFSGFATSRTAACILYGSWRSWSNCSRRRYDHRSRGLSEPNQPADVGTTLCAGPVSLPIWSCTSRLSAHSCRPTVSSPWKRQPGCETSFHGTVPPRTDRLPMTWPGKSDADSSLCCLGGRRLRTDGSAKERHQIKYTFNVIL